MSGMQNHGLTDPHCHLLPYVDDGAENLKESHALLTRQWEQGVEAVFLTVHLRTKMFETGRITVTGCFSNVWRKTGSRHWAEVRMCS